MCPRAYRSPSRESATAETRDRILASARARLGVEGAVNFTIDAVADGAGVARMTVYNQFGSKRGLVEALSDELAVRGGIRRLPEAFQARDAQTGLQILIEVFTGLWRQERLLIRRLRAVQTLDPELSRTNRDERRRQALLVLLRRMASETGRPAPDQVETSADLILVLTSFDAYELLLASGRDADSVAGLIVDSAMRLLEGPSTNHPG
jgi:AcrR family transcriptional regulator